ncbi:MAG: MFS transporter [Chloroflexi bacterium]|nr:MFS transporter [Chloroflexota bacterium]
MAKPPPTASSSPAVSVTDAVGWRRLFDVFEIRPYRLLWLGTLFSFGAMQMQGVARGWLVYKLTGSATALGGVTFAVGLPMVLLSLFGGVAADRWNKRNVILISQSMLCLVNFGLAILITIGVIQYWHVVIGAVLNGIVFSLNGPARTSLVADLVPEEKLTSAIAFNSTGTNLTAVAGPAVAGALIAAFGVEAAYYITSTFYLIAIVTIRGIPILAKAPIKRTVLGDLLEGLRFVRVNGTIRLLLVWTLLVVLFGMQYQVLLPVFAVDVLHVGASGLGTLLSAVGIGGLLGSLALAFLGDFEKKTMLLAGSCLALAAGLIFFSAVHVYALTLVGLGVVGFAGITYMATNNTIVMVTAGQQMRGRVMSLNTLGFGLQPMLALPVGIMADNLGAPLTVISAASVLLLGTVLLVGFRSALSADSGISAQ